MFQQHMEPSSGLLKIILLTDYNIGIYDCERPSSGSEATPRIRTEVVCDNVLSQQKVISERKGVVS